MNLPKIDNVIFDIGNVLVRWDARNLYRKLIVDEEEMRRFIADILPLEWHETLDKGKPFAQGVAERVAQFPAYAELIRAWDERWPETHGGAIEGSIAILKSLKAAGVPVYAITNYNAEKFASDAAMYDFYDIFDDRVVSGEVNLLKPDPAIYRLLIERNGLNPARSIFIDDRLDNLVGAESVGLKTHHFTTPETLRVALEKGGLLGS